MQERLKRILKPKNKVLNPTYNFKLKEEIILRDYLALERTRLANERTLLSYIRSSIYLLLGAVTFLQLDSFDTIHWFGYLTLVLSGVFAIIGFVRYYRLKLRLEREYFSKSKE